MACEHNVRKVLGYLESEEIVLKRVKEALENNLMCLQIDEMNLHAVYQSLKSKKKTETKNGVKVKKEPEIKTEPVSPPQQLTSSNTETAELKPLHLGPFSKTKKNIEELPELYLEPCNLDEFSDSEIDANEIPEVLLEPFYPDSEELSLDNSED